ncbi:MAG: hypothetical protein MUP73_04550 [Dehalococcoidia bacterium]|nr:hypothetical protein [Dehalococcoidia bacterium]
MDGEGYMMLDLGPIEERLGSVKKWIVIPGDGLADSNDAVWASDGTKWVCDVDPGMNCATFIAHAPEDIEALIAEVKKLRESIMRGLRCTQPNNT